MLQDAVVGLSRDERLELRDFIEMTLGASPHPLTDEQKSAVRRRADQMDSDPNLGSTWEDVRAELLVDPR